MTTWSSDELDKIGAADELELAPRRPDGTLRHPVTIWVVRLGDNLYIRSYHGQRGSWYRAAQTSQYGQIRAGGVEKSVRFAAADTALNDQIDDAYRRKYGRHSQYVAPMLAPQVRETTLELIPADTTR